MPGMPDDAGQTRYLDKLTTLINNLDEDFQDELGDTGEETRELISHWIANNTATNGTMFFTPAPARKHILEHWLNKPTHPQLRHRGWWRKYDTLAGGDDPDYSFDKMMTEALIQTLRLRYNDLDGVQRVDEDGDPTSIDSCRIWLCAGVSCKIIVWDTGPNIVVLYMTPPSPDKLDRFMDYRRHILNAQKVDSARDEYVDRFEKDPHLIRKPHKTNVSFDPPGKNKEDFIIVTDENPEPKYKPQFPPNTTILEFDTKTSGFVSDVYAFRPYRRMAELQSPWIHP